MSVSTLFGVTLWPPFDLGATTSIPYDLAEAIAERFATLLGSTLAGFTELFESMAESTPTTPYLVFTISSGTPELFTDTSQWDDHRVKFEVFADTQAQANQLRDALAVGDSAAYLDQSLPFASGVMTPMVRVDRMEARERKRVAGSKLVFKACAVFQTRLGPNS